VRRTLIPALVVLAACVPGGGPAPVAPDRALALFDGICGESLPDFADAPVLMQAAGVTRPADDATGAMFGATEDISFRIEEGPGLGKSCRMVVATTDPAGMLDALRAATGGMQDTAFGPAGLYRGRRALLVVPAAAAAAEPNGRTYIDARLLSERTGG
jgi:hypothetical protein